MKSATLVLGSKIILMQNTSIGVAISIENMSAFSSAVSGFSKIEFKGIAKPSKMNKYQNLLVGAGFSETETEWNRNAGFDGNNSDVIDFSITYTKA